MLRRARALPRPGQLRRFLSGCRNALAQEAAKNIRKLRPDRSGGVPLPSLCRPPVTGHDERRRFPTVIGVGTASEDVAVKAVGLALAWLEWLNNYWPLKPISNTHPAGARERYDAMLDEQAMAA